MKIDVHVHTSQVSGCGKVAAADMVQLYRQAGYDAIVVTDHLIAGKNADMPAAERVNWYLGGYRAAKAEGDKLGLTVLLGAEVRFFGGNEDFLLFGVQEDDIQWIFELLDGDIRLPEFYSRIHETGRMLLLQAHPFRENLRAMPLDQLDGIEVFNAHPGHDSHNDLAKEYAAGARAGFVKTSGSDAHQIVHVGRGGMITDEPIESGAQLVSWLRQHPEGDRIETA